MKNDYLKWLSSTSSNWWNDSAELSSMTQAIENGATGVTTNPLLVKRSLYNSSESWQTLLNGIKKFTAEDKAEEIIRRITVEIAKLFMPIYESSKGEQGFVCTQVNPKYQGDTRAMIEMGRRLASWSANIAVKLPATAAGLDALEELTASGTTTVGTISFSVSQAVETARRQQLGITRARANGSNTAKAFSVIMVGRLDDYLRDIALDMHLPFNERDIRQAGTACMKKAYSTCTEQGFDSILIPAGMRESYHAIALAGAKMTMSLSTAIQAELEQEKNFSEHIEEEVSRDVINRLQNIPEFIRAYEPDGMKPTEFIAYGATQRTLSQFIEAGWMPIQEYEL